METLKQIVLGVVVALIGVAVIWNLAGLYLIHTKKMTDISGGGFTFIVPQGKTRIYCNGSPIVTLDTDSINGMSIGETEYKVLFADKSMQTYVCGLKSVGIYTDKGATNDNSSSK